MITCSSKEEAKSTCKRWNDSYLLYKFKVIESKDSDGNKVYGVDYKVKGRLLDIIVRGIENQIMGKSE
jgi:hypothetical protein